MVAKNRTNTTSATPKIYAHGYYGFSTGRCNCDVCKTAGREYRRMQRAKRLTWLTANPNDEAHGTRAAYDCGCRCEICRQARKDARVRLNEVERYAARLEQQRSA